MIIKSYELRNPKDQHTLHIYIHAYYHCVIFSLEFLNCRILTKYLRLLKSFILWQIFQDSILLKNVFIFIKFKEVIHFHCDYITMHTYYLYFICHFWVKGHYSGKTQCFKQWKWPFFLLNISNILVIFLVSIYTFCHFHQIIPFIISITFYLC